MVGKISSFQRLDVHTGNGNGGLVHSTSGCCIYVEITSLHVFYKGSTGSDEMITVLTVTCALAPYLELHTPC